MHSPPLRLVAAMFRSWTRHLHVSHVLFAALVIIGACYPARSRSAMDALTQWFSAEFSGLILFSTAFFLLFSLYLAFGPYGKLRLGAPGEKPTFSTPAWLAMLFAAGMGSGLVFHGAAEPLLHYASPPPVEGEEPAGAAAVRQSMVITFFHWGVHAWAIYTIAALVVAYGAFRHKKPMLPSTPVRPLLGERFRVPAEELINTLAVLSVVFGLVASLGQGSVLVYNGLVRYFPAPARDIDGYIMVMLALALCYIGSSMTGIGKGIKHLSHLNLWLTVGLMLFVFFAGPTEYILKRFFVGLTDYLIDMPLMSTNLHQYSNDTGWIQSWPITYLLWWISWGPFVGIFIARISRGRTIREFVLGVLLVPALFSLFWFAVFGGAALHAEQGAGAGLGDAAVAHMPDAAYALMHQLPWAELTIAVMVLLTFIFLVTSADSGSYVLGMFTSRGMHTPPRAQRLFWGSIITAITLGALSAGQGLAFIRSFAVAGAIPYLLVMLLQSACLIRCLRQDAAAAEALPASR